LAFAPITSAAAVVPTNFDGRFDDNFDLHISIAPIYGVVYGVLGKGHERIIPPRAPARSLVGPFPAMARRPIPRAPLIVALQQWAQALD
jgi:hypothetical protein